MLRGAVLAVIGCMAFWKALVSLVAGVFHSPGKHGGPFTVTFASEPGLFLAVIALMLLLGTGALAVAWKFFKGQGE